MNMLKKIFTIALLVTIPIALYFYFMAPIGECFSTGIPYTSYSNGTTIVEGVPKIKATELVQGDHLQLQYHFDLFSKMLKGDIPAFHNLYEFNTGSDADRKIIDPYYIPFSFTYAIAQFFSTDAFAWNFSQLLSAICSFIFLYLIVSRFTSKETLKITCIAITIIAMTVPYRWVNLAGGSPTGFGMALVPGVFLGIDMAIRDKRFGGGLLAGVLTFLLYCTDLHCFFFSVCATPGYCILSWLYRADKGSDIIPNKKDIIYLTKNLIPIPLACLCAMIFAMKLSESYTTTDVAGGRSLEELHIHSPVIEGLVDYTFPHFGSMHFNIGWILVGLIILACITSIVAVIYYSLQTKNNLKKQDNNANTKILTRKLIISICALLLCLAVILTIILALGTNGPQIGIAARALRKLLPPYQMIRQPVKIYCLLPTLLAPLLIMVWNFFCFKNKKNQVIKGLILFPITLLSLAVAQKGMWCGICLLPNGKQLAYDEAKIEAISINKTPRALILPIWPGDSSWSSAYEYYSIRNDLRMLNGYSAVKALDYFDDVFCRYETVTQGIISEDNEQTLKTKHKVTSIIVHENLFPDKVSPLPVGYTLKNFIKNPKLQFIKHDRDAWSFSLFPNENKTKYTLLEKTPQTFCPARIWHFNNRSNGKGLIPETFKKNGSISYLLRRPAADAGNGETWLTLEEELKTSSRNLDASFVTNNYHRAGMWVVHTPEPQNLIFVSDGKEFPAIQLKDKHGVPLPLAASPIGTTSYNTNGFVSLEIKGSSPIHTTAYMPILDIIDPRESPREIAAADLFHDGFTGITIDETQKTISLDSIILEPKHVPAGLVYGPNLPIIGGTWQVELKFALDSPKIGTMVVYANGTQIASGTVEKPLEFTVKNCEFINVCYDYPEEENTVILESIIFSAK